ncbi:MAG: DUF945 domain-containing protein [Betaproteobacteria bacterium]|nr:MAG: DUF945 domain-containing protein [Betaproteobacteria bacterium]
MLSEHHGGSPTTAYQCNNLDIDIQASQKISVKKLIALLVAAGVIGFPASTWYFGRQAQAMSTQLTSTVTAAIPYVSVVSNDYQKGFFKSTQTLKLRPALPGFDAKPEHEISVVNVIEHGPLPGFKGVGAARITHSVVLPPEAQKAVAAVYGQQSPINAVTVMNIAGGGTTTLSSPKVSGKTPEGTFAFQGLDGVVKFSSGMQSFNYSVSAPGLEYSDAKQGKLTLGALAMTGAQTKVAGTEQLYVGKQESTVTGVDVINAGKPTLSMKQIRYAVDSSNAEKDFMNGSGKLNAASIKAGELDLGTFDYEFSMQKLHVASLDALSKSIQATVSKASADAANSAGSTAKPGGVNPMQSAMGMNNDMLAALKQHLPELSKHQPSFTLDKLRIGTDKDLAMASASVRLLPIAATDLDNPMALIPKLDASLNVELSDSFLNLLAGTAASRIGGGAMDNAAVQGQMTPEMQAAFEAQKAQQAAQTKQMVDAQLQGAVAEGYIIRGVGKVSAQLTLKAGQLLVNGRPMGPNMAQPK